MPCCFSRANTSTDLARSAPRESSAGRWPLAISASAFVSAGRASKIANSMLRTWGSRLSKKVAASRRPASPENTLAKIAAFSRCNPAWFNSPAAPTRAARSLAGRSLRNDVRSGRFAGKRRASSVEAPSGTDTIERTWSLSRRASCRAFSRGDIARTVASFASATNWARSTGVTRSLTSTGRRILSSSSLLMPNASAASRTLIRYSLKPVRFSWAARRSARVRPLPLSTTLSGPTIIGPLSRLPVSVRRASGLSVLAILPI